MTGDFREVPASDLPKSSTTEPGVALRTSLESVVGGGLALVVGRMIGLVFGLVSAMLVSRHLGVSDYGRMSSVVAFWSIFGLTSEMGVLAVVASEMAKPGSDTSSLWLAGVLVQTAFSVVAWIAGFAVGAWLFKGQPEMRIGMAVGSFLVFASMPAVNSIHQKRLKMRLPAALGIVQSSLVMFLSLAGVLLGQPWHYFVAASAVCGVLVVIVNSLFAWRESGWERKPSVEYVKRIVRASLVVGLAGIFATGYFKLDTVLVFRIAGVEQVGLYSAAYRLFEIALIVPTAVMVAAIPVAAKLLHADIDRYRHYSGKVLTILICLGVAVSSLVTEFSRIGLLIIFGNRFNEAILLLVLLMPGAMVRYMSIWMGTLLIATGRRGRFFWIAAFSACVAIGVDLVLIRVLAARGAAIVTSGIETCVLAATWFSLDQRNRPKLSRTAVLAFLAGIPLWCIAGIVGLRARVTIPWFAIACIPMTGAVLLARAAVLHIRSLERVN